MTDVTQLYCPDSGAQPGEDNSTHHLHAPYSEKPTIQTCRYCGRTVKELRQSTVVKVRRSVLVEHYEFIEVEIPAGYDIDEWRENDMVGLDNYLTENGEVTESDYEALSHPYDHLQIRKA